MHVPKGRKSKATNKSPANEPEVDGEIDGEAGRDVAEEGEAEPEAEAGRPASPTDNVGDISVEVNVEDLIAQIESESKGGPAPDGSARRKIEDILEEKRIAKEIMDLEDFDIEE